MRLRTPIDAAAADDGVGAGEVDVLEEAEPLGLRRERLQRVDGDAAIRLGLADHHLAVLDVAHELGADDVERAGLRGKDRLAVELAEDQRPDAVGVAGADQLGAGQRDQRVGALEMRQRIDEAVGRRGLPRAGDEVEHHLGVRGRLADRALRDQLAAQRQAVGEVAVMRDGDAADLELGEQRLHVAQDRLAGGRVADMAHRHVAGQAREGRGVGEVVADEAELALGMELPAVEARRCPPLPGRGAAGRGGRAR